MNDTTWYKKYNILLLPQYFGQWPYQDNTYYMYVSF